MTKNKLIIRKGEFNIYSEIYSNIKFKTILTEISEKNKLSFSEKQYLISLINNNKDLLISIFGEKLLISFFDGLNIDSLIIKLDFLIKLYKKYSIDRYLDNLSSIIIEDDLEIINCNDIFIKTFILCGSYTIIIKGNFFIKDFNLNGKHTIKNLYIHKNFEIVYTSKNKIKFIDCEFSIGSVNKGDYSFNIKDGKDKILEFEGVLFLDLKISFNFGIKSLIFDNCKGNIELFSNEIDILNINNSSFTSIIIKDNILKSRCRISTEPINGEYLKTKIGSINFINNSIKDLRIGHSIIDILNIENIKNPTDSEINLGDLELKKLRISNIRNLGKIRFYDINYGKKENSKKEIDINNSSFGDSEFQNFNLNSFKDVYLYDNLFSDLKYTGVNWVYTIKVDKNTNYGKLRNSYRIFKEVAERNSDNITALKFYAKEMEAHRIYLLNKGFIKNCLDLIIIFFNKYSSNYGLWFILPILWIIYLNFLSLGFIFYFEDSKIIELYNINDFFLYFFKSFIITNGFEQIFGIKNNNSILEFIIYIKNIFLAYFIYQLLLSFRKFTRNI